MSITKLYLNISLFAYGLGVKARQKLLTAPALMVMGLGSTIPGLASANGIRGVLGRWEDTINDGIDFIMVVALIMGVGAILYGVKLILDKTNERADVKNGHIVFAFVAGSFLCVLWFVVTILVETTAGSSSGIGKRS